MHRMLSAVIAILGILWPVAPAPAWAAAAVAASPAPAAPPEEGAHAKKGETLDGTVAAVDYAGNTFVVEVAGRGKVTVIVKPSTDFEGTPGYHSITDVVRGANVTVLSSVVGDKTFAEIVTFKTAQGRPPR